MFTVHESGIKIFEEFIHPDDIDKDFLESQELVVGDVFIICGDPYRVRDVFEDGDLDAVEIKSIGLDEWVLGGNSHPLVKWHGSFATYEDGNQNNQRPKLVPFRGRTYFCHPYTGKILTSVEGECIEYSDSSSDSTYTGYSGIGSWSDKGYY